LTQSYPVICSDGGAGANIAWLDNRNNKWDIYAQKLNGAGTPQWTTNGVAVRDATLDNEELGMCSDQLGGAILVWTIISVGGDTIAASHIPLDGGIPGFTLLYLLVGLISVLIIAQRKRLA
jgi:hypothetical protein